SVYAPTRRSASYSASRASRSTSSSLRWATTSPSRSRPTATKASNPSQPPSSARAPAAVIGVTVTGRSPGPTHAPTGTGTTPWAGRPNSVTPPSAGTHTPGCRGNDLDPGSSRAASPTANDPPAVVSSSSASSAPISGPAIRATNRSSAPTTAGSVRATSRRAIRSMARASVPGATPTTHSPNGAPGGADG